MTSTVLGQIDSARKIKVVRRLRGIDTVEVELDERAALDSGQLVAENTLYLPYVDADAPLAFLLEQVGRDDDAKKLDMVVSGRTLDGIALDGRLAVPDPANFPTDTTGHDTQSAVAAETAIKHYVKYNAGSSALASRQVPGLTVATDALRGATVSYKARYESVLRTITELCLKADLGWKVTYEVGTGLHTFEVIVPTDRSSSVFFDFEFDSLEHVEETESLIDSRNVAVVAGQGELTARDIQVRGSVTGLQRREAFVDARDVELGNTTLLQQRGDAFLAASTPTMSIVATPRQFGPFQYTRDFHLGDYVLVRNYKRGVSFSAQIIEVHITVDRSASVPTVECILDRPTPTLQSRITGSPVTGARQDQAVSTAGPDADITVDAAGAAGTASTYARAGHGHKLTTSSATPSALGDTGGPGTSGTAPSRGNHAHPDTGWTNFTPGVTFGGGSTGMTFTTQQGRYKRTGNLLQFRVRVTLSAKGTSTGAALITNLPVASANTAPPSSCAVGQYSGLAAGVTGMYARISAALATTITLNKPGAGAIAGMTDADFTNTTDIFVSGQYEV